jgi:spore coat polysaccharide biosynthesis protein SpsF
MESLKVGGLIQARMSSSRLPGKVLMNLIDNTVLGHVVNQVKASKCIDEVIVLTSDDISDNVIVEWCQNNDTKFFRGSLNDVLDRYYKAAIEFNIDSIIRITADCPLVDPDIIDEIYKRFSKDKYDFYSLSGSFPDGLDCSIISLNALKKAWKSAKLKSEREHVSPYIEKNTELFKTGGYEKFNNMGHIRITLDEKKDFELLKHIFDNLYTKNSIIKSKKVINFLNDNKDLLNINSKITRNEGYLKSLKND